jgi:hypothetical protein
VKPCRETLIHGLISLKPQQVNIGPLAEINGINGRLAETSLLELKAIYQHLLNNIQRRY